MLVLNCGSSSLKFGVYAPEVICEGEAEEIGGGAGTFWISRGAGGRAVEQVSFADHCAALAHILEQLGDVRYEAVGHRFVHGGPSLRGHARVTPEVMAELNKAVEYAPLHMPSALAVLRGVQEKKPQLPQVVCLDTAFHRHLPAVSRTYALPEKARILGVERYGFHGLSLESIVGQLRPLPRRLVAAHLGNGSSVTAIRDGISIDTSMGLTPTGGVMMGTRCGDLDPGVLIFLLRHGFGGAEELEQLCDHDSGLLGVSGSTSDVRELVKRRATDGRAQLALAMFCYQVRKTIAGMAAALGGVDALVFAGGIGENAAEVRDEIQGGLGFLGNFAVQIVPSREDEQIARITVELA